MYSVEAAQAQREQGASVVEQLARQHDGVQAAQKVSSISDGLGSVWCDCADQLGTSQRRREQTVLNSLAQKEPQ